MKKTILYGVIALISVVTTACTSSDLTVTTTPTIERAARQKAVDYTDRRNPTIITRYTDDNSDGYLDKVVYFTIEAKPRIVFTLAPSEQLAEKANAERFGRGADYTPEVFFWVRSPEARNLQHRYRDVVYEYVNLHREAARPPEWEPRLEAASVDQVKNFGKWVDEYLARSSDQKLKQNGRSGEIAAYKQYLVKDYTAKAYDKLNDRERDALFDWDYALGSDALKIGRNVGMLLGGGREQEWSYWPRNPRREIEERFSDSQEVDYMSSWTISQELDQLKLAYENELRGRGFTF